MSATADQVRGLVDAVPDDFDFVQILLTARLIREEYLDITLLSTKKLDYLELLIACHFTVLNIEKGGMVKQTIGDASETYHDLHARLTGLYSTRYGSQAIAFDTSGVLASLSSGQQRAEFEVY